MQDRIAYAREPRKLPVVLSAGEVVRSHWDVENRLHWRLVVTMNEDAARNRMDDGPYNFAVLRHMTLNVIGKEESRGSLRAKFK
jgi:predicted transposase YbfD/YdcC